MGTKELDTQVVLQTCIQIECQRQPTLCSIQMVRRKFMFIDPFFANKCKEYDEYDDK